MYRFSAWRLNRQLDQESTPLRDPTIGALADRMGRALDMPKVHVHVYEVAPINGLAAPDGRIFLTRGFMNEYVAGRVTAEELASVIAHELGHVALGHSRRRMFDFAGQNAIRVVATVLLGRLIPVIGPWLAGMLASVIAARLSRQDEYEADAYAAALMTKIGIGTGPQISLFAKLDALSGKLGGTPGWLLSHPRTQERVAAIEALERKWAGVPEG